MALSDVEVWHIKEALLLARDEFTELVKTKDWYCTEAIEMIESALEILDHEG